MAMLKKCKACGYKKGKGFLNYEDVDKGNLTEVNPHGEEFDIIKGPFFAHDMNGSYGLYPVELSICPECGTVRADKVRPTNK